MQLIASVLLIFNIHQRDHKIMSRLGHRLTIIPRCLPSNNKIFSELLVCSTKQVSCATAARFSSAIPICSEEGNVVLSS